MYQYINISSSKINNDKQPSLQNLKYYKELPKITNRLEKKKLEN